MNKTGIYLRLVITIFFFFDIFVGGGINFVYVICTILSAISFYRAYKEYTKDHDDL